MLDDSADCLVLHDEFLVVGLDLDGRAGFDDFGEAVEDVVFPAQFSAAEVGFLLREVFKVHHILMVAPPQYFGLVIFDLPISLLLFGEPFSQTFYFQLHSDQLKSTLTESLVASILQGQRELFNSPFSDLELKLNFSLL